MLLVGMLTIGLMGLAEPTIAGTAADFAPSQNIANNANLPTNNQSPSEILLNGVRVFMQVLGLVALILILYAGFTMLTSGGNSEKIGNAKNILVWTAIGALVILSSLGILEYIDAVFYGS
jgi:hypothetical protein